MPGFMTHYLFGMKIMKRLPLCSLTEAVRRHAPSFLLGLQGPDIFFFYLPSLMGSQEKNIGSRMHETRISSFFARMLEETGPMLQVENAPDPAGRYHSDTAFSYLAGFICHYTLDYISHPYVYYLADCAPGHNSGQAGAARHRSLETRLDTFMLRQLKHQEPSRFSRYRAMPLNRFEEGFLSLFLCRCINNVYYPDTSHAIYEAFEKRHTGRYIDRQYYKGTRQHRLTPKAVRRILKSLRRECRFLDDRTGIKKRLMELFELFLFRYPLLSSLMAEDHIADTKDELNLAHKPWHNPWEPEKERRESFPDLFYTSLDIAFKTLSLLNCYKEQLEQGKPGSLEKEALLSQLGSFSYHSGLPVDH